MNNMSTVVIVGRMNVGKSTLFNRLSRTVKSMTFNFEGVTRDFIKDQVEWFGHTFILVDTGGISLRKSSDELQEKVRQVALKAVEDADVVLLICDGKVGVQREDQEILQQLRKMHKKVILVVNKIDSKDAQEHAGDFYRLQREGIVFISAEQAAGVDELLDMVCALLPAQQKEIAKPDYRVMLLGKPNVGKSSLLNALLEQERAIVSAIAGTTREPISENINFYKEHILMSDTPGVRRSRSVSGDLEPMMVKSSFQILRDADIVLLLIDASEGAVSDQELKLGFYAFTQQYKGLIILLNKQDLETDETKRTFEISIRYYEHLFKKVPVLHISCASGKNIGKLLPLIKKVWERYSQWLSDEEINRLLVSSLQKKPLFHQSEHLRLYKVKQLSTAPITIGLEVNKPEWFGESQLGFFENLLRSQYDLVGVPIRFIVRTKL